MRAAAQHVTRTDYSGISGLNRTPTPRSPCTVGVFCENAASMMLPLKVTTGVSGTLKPPDASQPPVLACCYRLAGWRT